MFHFLSGLAGHFLERGTILGYWVVLLAAFLESLAFVGIVVPGSVIVVIAGGLAAQGIYDIGDMIVFATVGAILGDACSYELGRSRKEWLQAHPKLWAHVERVRPFFARYGKASVFVGRFVGPVRPIIPVIAGITHMPRRQFYLVNVTSGFGWSLTFLMLGYLFGTAWKVALVRGFREVLPIALVLLVLLLLFGMLKWVFRKEETIHSGSRK